MAEAPQKGHALVAAHHMKVAVLHMQMGPAVDRVGLVVDRVGRTHSEVAHHSLGAVRHLAAGLRSEDVRGVVDRHAHLAGHLVAARSPLEAHHGGIGEGCAPWADNRAHLGGLAAGHRVAADPVVVAATCRHVAETGCGFSGGCGSRSGSGCAGDGSRPCPAGSCCASKLPGRVRAGRGHGSSTDGIRSEMRVAAHQILTPPASVARPGKDCRLGKVGAQAHAPSTRRCARAIDRRSERIPE